MPFESSTKGVVLQIVLQFVIGHHLKKTTTKATRPTVVIVTKYSDCLLKTRTIFPAN